MTEASTVSCRSEGVQWPERPANFLLAPELLLVAIETLNDRLSSSALEHYRRFAELFSKEADKQIVHEELFTDMLNVNERQIVMKTLFDLAKKEAQQRRDSGKKARPSRV